MNTFLHFVAVAGFLIMVWYLRLYLLETVNYKEARRAEIKRRLQVEVKQEEALKTALSGSVDDSERLKLVTKFADERHKRAIHYTIEDMFERHQ